LCDALLKENLHILWECNTRVDLVDEDLFKKMRRAGCNAVKVGIESGSDRILKSMNKGVSREQMERAADVFARVGIHWTGYFMIGVPGETKEDIAATLDLMYRLQPDFASISVYEPFPGTPMFVEGVAKGLVKESMTLEEFYAGSPTCYYKVEAGRQVETMDEREFAELAAHMKERFHAYNGDPRRLWKKAKSRLRVYRYNPGATWKDFAMYLNWR
jgi:radical SAM superfamily enzyme YgiQ (UPF0313 family)